MQVIRGFVTLGALIALGYVLARSRVLGRSSQLTLSRLAFFVGSPALLITVLSDADASVVLSRQLAASAAAALAAAGMYLGTAYLLFRRRGAELVIGTLASSYVNAGNLGIPIAAYVLGDAALAAPTLLMQILFIQPCALAVLDSMTPDSGFRLKQLLWRPLVNPMTLASLAGLVLSITDTSIPRLIADPLELAGGMAIPAMLLAYGLSLQFGPRPGSGSSGEIVLIAVIKLLVQPLGGYLLASYVFGLNDLAVLAVTVTAALPTAQNVFIHATRYRREITLARDSVFVTTILAAPAMFVISTTLA